MVGKELVNVLLSSKYYDHIVIINRREVKYDDSRVEEVVLENFDELDSIADKFNVNDMYCCLGTTKKKAGSKEVYRKIDHDYPIKMAELAMKQPDFKQYLVVTAAGANPDSPLFYNQLKGDLEKSLRELNLNSLKIFRPSLLLGQRDEFRLLEEIAKYLSAILTFFMIGSSTRGLWSIYGHEVARSMLIVAKWEEPGTKIFSSKKMKKLTGV